MTEISMSWNKKVSLREIAMFYENKLRELQGKQDAMINNLNEQISRFREKIQELNGKITEYEKQINEGKEVIAKQMDHHRDVLDLFTSTDEERMTSLLRQLVNEIRPLIDRDYEKTVHDLNQRLKEITYELSERIDEEIERTINDIVDKKHHIFKVAKVDAETARHIFEGVNDDKRFYL